MGGLRTFWLAGAIFALALPLNARAGVLLPELAAAEEPAVVTSAAPAPAERPRAIPVLPTEALFHVTSAQPVKAGSNASGPAQPQSIPAPGQAVATAALRLPESTSRAAYRREVRYVLTAGYLDRIFRPPRRVG